MYHFNYQGKKKVLKILYNDKGPLFGQKFYTLEALDHYKDYLPESFLCPDTQISISGHVKGFSIPYFEGVNLADLLNDKTVDEKEKIYYLAKIGEVLNQLKNIRKYSPLKEIYINDLYESNILVNPNNKELKIIDLDSCKILNNGSFPGRRLSKSILLEDKPHKYIYNTEDDEHGFITANENSDLFCYNIMILNYLYGQNILTMTTNEFYKYLKYLESIEFNKELLNCFKKLAATCDNQNPYYLLDTITYQQTYRAKKLVYEVNRK